MEGAEYNPTGTELVHQTGAFTGANPLPANALDSLQHSLLRAFIASCKSVRCRRLKRSTVAKNHLLDGGAIKKAEQTQKATPKLLFCY